MQQRPFGTLGDISALTLGGGGTGQVWGPTSRQEATATVREAGEAGITFFDVAPSYGRGEAEWVLGAAFGGRLPEGIRVSTKCAVGNRAASEVLPLLEQSLDESLARLQLDRVDLFFLHNQIVPDETADPILATPRRLFVEAVRPAFEHLVARGRIGAWGITGIGVPSTIIEMLNEDPAPAAVQVVTNLLDSPGAMQRYDDPPQPRAIIAAAHRRGIGVMGIRAVQAGALTDAFDREVPADHPDWLDYQRSAPFRTLAQEIGESPASLAHRYALSMAGVATVVLGVKNRTELRECLTAEARGVLDSDLMARIDAAVGRGPGA
jgi:aryl-alcohol dehydrogenase-like predicted oxidoreductase